MPRSEASESRPGAPSFGSSKPGAAGRLPAATALSIESSGSFWATP
ncbi:MAG TPA: hypothetical protein VF517_09310 [Thermoleophilaceae bacterium]